MTARFVYWMNVSLDLFIERTDGEQGAGDRLRIDEQFHREFNERAGRLSMLVEGRLIYDMMDSFWPDARADESVPDYLREYGGIWTDKPKVLVSRTRRTASRTTRAGSAVRMPSICSPNFGAPATATSASAAPRSPPHCARAPARRAAALHAPGCARRGSPARRRARRAAAARSAPAEIVPERRDDAPLRGARRSAGN